MQVETMSKKMNYDKDKLDPNKKGFSVNMEFYDKLIPSKQKEELIETEEELRNLMNSTRSNTKQSALEIKEEEIEDLVSALFREDEFLFDLKKVGECQSSRCDSSLLER